jgi:hypothetical protein
MKFDIHQCNEALAEHDIQVIYSGPIWANGIDGMAEMLLRRLEYDEIPRSASQSVFSAFVEQMNSMLMYSADKERRAGSDGKGSEVSQGVYVFGIKDSSYFIQTGNVVTLHSAEMLKVHLDYLNTLDKKELREYYKQQLRDENENDPKGWESGMGLIEIARRAAGPIEYSFEPLEDGLQYFTMYITIWQGQGGKE